MPTANRLILDRRFWLLPILIWSLIVLSSYLWNWRDLDRHTHQLALNRAQFIFKMVDSVRLWNARHGGVYAEVNSETLPNPYLEIDERDITTPTGRELTMINPAYMTRQVAEVVQELSGIRVHITSLNPINPGNERLPWESRMLQAFERGEREQQELVGSAETAQFRYMAPLVTKQACLKCHEKQGYKVGDIRGGVSVSFDAGALFAPAQDQHKNLIVVHLSVWLLLAGLTLFALQRFRRQMLSLDALVEQRTGELRQQVTEREQAEAKLRLFIESSGEAIYAMDRQGLCTLVNPQALRLLGYVDESQLLGRSMHGIIHHTYADGSPHDSGQCRLLLPLSDGEPSHGDDDLFRRADGTSFPVEYRCHPIISDGTVLGAVVTFSDISERKAQEAELRKLSGAVEHSPASAVITDVDGRIEYVNQKFVEITGYRSEEVIGFTPRKWKSGRMPLSIYRELWTTILDGRQWRGELLNCRRDGQLFWEETSISPIRNTQGEITHFVSLSEDITERKRSEEAIWHQANYDQLTGLANRERFGQLIDHCMTQSEEEGSGFALLYLDLDGFKQVNDTLGHHAGDLLLKEAAQRIQRSLRDSDHAARLGGDEFAILLPAATGAEGAVVVAGNLIDCLAEPFMLEVGHARITASVGIAFYPESGRSAEQLLQCADEAMYLAKRAGRNRYHLYPTSGNDQPF